MGVDEIKWLGSVKQTNKTVPSSVQLKLGDDFQRSSWGFYRKSMDNGYADDMAVLVISLT